MALRLSIVLLFAFFFLGCLQSGPSPPPVVSGSAELPPSSDALTVQELFERKEEFLGQTVTVTGRADLMVTACTEEVCFLPENCTPGERQGCNSCSVLATLQYNNYLLNLESVGGGDLCTGLEMLVCEGTWYMDYTDCPVEDGKNYAITGLFQERFAGNTPYYLMEVERVEKN